MKMSELSKDELKIILSWANYIVTEQGEISEEEEELIGKLESHSE